MASKSRLSQQIRLALLRLPKPLLAQSKPAGTEKLALSRQDWWAVAGAALAAFLAVLDIQITNASLREIQSDLNLDFSESGWVSTSYLVAEVAVIPLVGILSLAFGFQRFFVTVAVAFVCSSVFCGFSWDLGSMIFFRAIQGLCGGALIPLAFQTLLITMPAAKRNLGLAIFGLTATLAPTLGPSVGGYLTETWGWRFAFWLNIAPGILMAVLLQKGLLKDTSRMERLRQIDLWGAGFLALALGAMTYCLEEGPKHDWWESVAIRFAMASAFIGAVGFGWRYLRCSQKLIDLSLLRRRNFGIAVSVTAIAAAALYGGVYALSLYLGQVQGYGAMAIGEVLMWVGVPQLFVMPLLPFLMTRIDARYLIGVGLGLFAWSLWINTGMDASYAGDQLRVALVIRALGQPLFLVPLSAVGMSEIRPQESAQASMLFNMFRNIGGSIGISLVSTQVLELQRGVSQLMHQRVVLGDWRVLERVSGLKWYLVSQTQDLRSAEDQALRLVQSLLEREAAVLSFGQVFGGMAVLLLVCVAAVFLIRPVRPSSSQETTHAH